MKWTEGRSNGATSVVQRSAIKSGAIAVGSKVSVVWGKSKKTYNAEVVGNGNVAQVQQANSHEDEPFVMELVDPVPADTQGPPSREERQPAVISRMEQLHGRRCYRFGSQDSLPLRRHRILTYKNAGRLGLSKVCCCLIGRLPFRNTGRCPSNTQTGTRRRFCVSESIKPRSRDANAPFLDAI